MDKTDSVDDAAPRSRSEANVNKGVAAHRIAVALCIVVAFFAIMSMAGYFFSQATGTGDHAETANTGTSAAPDQGAVDRHAEGMALQRWAQAYDPSDGLFEDTVAIDSYGTTFTFTATGSWYALTDDEQHDAVANATTAVKMAWCMQSDHRGELIPGLTVRIIDDEGSDLSGDVTGSGLICQ